MTRVELLNQIKSIKDYSSYRGITSLQKKISKYAYLVGDCFNLDELIQFYLKYIIYYPDEDNFDITLENIEKALLTNKAEVLEVE